MSVRAAALGRPDADEKLVDMIVEAAATPPEPDATARNGATATKSRADDADDLAGRN